MTHDYKKALDALLNYQQADMDGTMVLTSRQAIHEIANYALQLAQEAEQLRKERDELARAIIKIHEDQEGDYDFLKFISHPQYILAKKVAGE